MSAIKLYVTEHSIIKKMNYIDQTTKSFVYANLLFQSSADLNVPSRGHVSSASEIGPLKHTCILRLK